MEVIPGPGLDYRGYVQPNQGNPPNKFQSLMDQEFRQEFNEIVLVAQ